MAARPAVAAPIHLVLSGPPVRLPRTVSDGPEVFASDIPPGAVELAFAGDVNLADPLGGLILRSGVNAPWSGVADVLRNADLAIVNLECAVSDRGAPSTGKEFTFRAAPESVRGMANAGVDIAAVANNHALDFGRDAFTDTLAHLRTVGITPAGGGSNATRAWAPVYRDVKGIRIGLVAATKVLPLNFAATSGLPGVASAYDRKALLASVRAAAANSDVTVVFLHWGVERTSDPTPDQMALTKELVRAGAKVIIGSHPHRLHPVIRVGGALVATSLGNFVFSSPSAGGRDSMILRVGILPDHSVVAVPVGVRIDGGRPRLLRESVPS